PCAGGTLKNSEVAKTDAITGPSSSVHEISAPSTLKLPPVSKTFARADASLSARNRIVDPAGRCVATEHMHSQLYSPTRSCTCSSISAKFPVQVARNNLRLVGVQYSEHKCLTSH